MKVYLLDEIDYQNRGGAALAFESLEGAMAAAYGARYPWEHRPAGQIYAGDDKYVPTDESWGQRVGNDTIAPCWEIRLVEVQP